MKRGLEITLSQRELLSAVGLGVLAAAPHLFHLPSGIGAFFVSMAILRLAALYRPRLLPGRLLLVPLTFGGLAIVLFNYPILFGKEAGVALLISMLGLKLMEIRQRRDIYVLVFIGYFTLATLFLFQQGMAMLLYTLLVVTGLTAALVETTRAQPSEKLYQPFRVAARLLLQAVPVALVLFLLFPRFSSPLWQLGVAQKSGVTGISDRLSPGSISRLSRSRAVAFRASFAGTVPAPAKRYWRGLVLWQTDGKEWTDESPQEAVAISLRAFSDPLRYSVTLEPYKGRWLFALDLPDQVPQGARLGPDFQLTRDNPITRRIHYQGSSRLEYNTGPISTAQRQLGLELPENITPRMRALVQEWREQAADDAELVRKGLNYFRTQPFYYTLYPPLVEENPSDQFLFDTRRGFCEHYATSFTLLMRLAGIPARVVVGYQGGEINPLGDYLIVRQSDAHAWTEVWLEGRGWVRIDPTAAVAPERIEQVLDLDQIPRLIGAPIDFTRMEAGYLRQLMRQIGWSMDAVNSAWQRWVLGYSSKRQSQLLEQIGLGFLQGTRLALGMVIGAAIALSLASLLILYRSRDKVDPVQRAYQRYCQRLQRRGLARGDQEGPADFARRVVRERPDLRRQAATITALYIGLRYGPDQSKQRLKRLQRLVTQFRP
jgi:transglutaminase-like putative cysteine protease